jgi:peptide methionine sulfoxide reductase MsrA
MAMGAGYGRAGHPSLGNRRRRMRVAPFSLQSFWRMEAVSRRVPEVLRSTARYTSGVKTNPARHF